MHMQSQFAAIINNYLFCYKSNEKSTLYSAVRLYLYTLVYIFIFICVYGLQSDCKLVRKRAGS